MMDWDGHMTTGGWIMMILWTVIVFALIAAAIYWLATSYRAGSATAATKDASAREILDQRLAKGELTIEQYQQLRDTLATPGPPTTLSASDGPQTPPPRAAGAASG